MISFSLLVESPRGQATPPPGHGHLEGGWDGTPQGGWQREACFPLRGPTRCLSEEQMAQEQRRHKQFSPPPAPSEETMPPPPSRTSTFCPSPPPCSQPSGFPPPAAEFPDEAGPGLFGDWGWQGPRAVVLPASVRDSTNGPAEQLTGHLRQVVISLALELLPTGARRHQSSAQGGHRGTIWHHLSGHSVAGA